MMTSNFRKLASQLCAIFPYSCLHVAHGVFTGYVVILIAELHRKNSEIPSTLNQLSWFAGLEIIRPILTLFTGLLMHRWGCRPLAFTAALLYSSAGLMYYYSTNMTILFMGRLLSSLLTVAPIANPYISEISEPQLRSHLFMVALLCSIVGAVFTLVLGSFMYWRTIALIDLIFPILAAVTVLATPQSHIWLANRGCLEKAQKSLCWVRGWVNSKQIQAELETLINSVQKSTLIKPTFVIETITWQKRLKNFFKLFIQRSFYIPLATISLIFLLYSLDGISTVDTFATVIFQQLNSPIEESIATAIMETMVMVGCILAMFFIHRVGKRNLLFISVSATGFGYAAVSLVGFLELTGRFLWIPPIAVIGARFVNTMGITALMFMLPSEIFPSSVRYIGSSISFSVKMIMESVMKKLFLYMVEAITLPGVFAFFAFMNLVGLIIYYFVYPETEGRSLREIENKYTAVRCEEVREISDVNGYQSD